MKKFYLLFLSSILIILTSTTSIMAQQRCGLNETNISQASGSSEMTNDINMGAILPNIPTKIGYDTVFFEDFQSQAIPGTWQNLDLDGSNDAMGRPVNWFIFSDFETTVGTDTNWVAASSSWFSTFTPANNWLILPGINIVNGDLLVWKSAPFEGPSFCDGYKVMISTTDSLTTSFTDTLAVFAESVNGTATQTAGVQHTNYNGAHGVLQTWSYDLSSYNGQRIFIAFVHDSDDDNLLMIDNILVKQECTPTAAYSYSANSQTVTFTNTSTSGASTSYWWDFGDGNTATQQNPTHSYAMPGTYTVCLIVTDYCSADTICATISVSACTPPTADFTSSPNGMSVTFTNTSTTGGAPSYFWDFGDGSTSTQQDPWHTYASQGNYTVCLIAQDSCAADTTCQFLTVSTVGVEILSDQEFVVFPNPTDGKFTIEFTSIQEYVSVSILSAIGQEIQTEVFENAQTIQLELNQPKGVYILELSDGKGNKTVMQIIKE